MTTRIDKMLAAARKRIEKHEAQVVRLDMVITKAIEKCRKAGDDVTESDFVECKGQSCANYHSYECVKELPSQDLFWLRYRVEQAMGDRYHHLYEIAQDRKQIDALMAEARAEEAKRKSRQELAGSSLAKVLRDALENFREAWMKKMYGYYVREWKYVDAEKSAAFSWDQRYVSLKRRFPRQLSDSRYNPHYRLAKQMQVKSCRMSAIYNHEAASLPMTSYLDRKMKETADEFERCIVKLTDKCRNFGIDEANVKAEGYDVTQKGFEAVIRDGQARRIYARMIWAAEDSVFMIPHVRYIVTEKAE